MIGTKLRTSALPAAPTARGHRSGARPLPDPVRGLRLRAGRPGRAPGGRAHVRRRPVPPHDCLVFSSFYGRTTRRRRSSSSASRLKLIRTSSPASLAMATRSGITRSDTRIRSTSRPLRSATRSCGRMTPWRPSIPASASSARRTERTAGERRRSPGSSACGWRSGRSTPAMRASYTTDEIVEIVLEQVEPGAIVLLHDGGPERPSVLEACARLLPVLREQGYELITLSELLEDRHGLRRPACARARRPCSSVAPRGCSP